jgi:hypothetical protein
VAADPLSHNLRDTTLAPALRFVVLYLASGLVAVVILPFLTDTYFYRSDLISLDGEESGAARRVEAAMMFAFVNLGMAIVTGLTLALLCLHGRHARLALLGGLTMPLLPEFVWRGSQHFHSVADLTASVLHLDPPGGHPGLSAPVVLRFTVGYLGPAVAASCALAAAVIAQSRLGSSGRQP